MRRWQPAIASRPASSASTSLARLGVDLAQERLAEVGQLGAREAADEALRADDPELELADLVHRDVALEHDHTGVARALATTSSQRFGVVVVVAEHGDDRDSSGRGTRRRGRRPAPARRASSGRRRGGRGRPAPSSARERVRHAARAAARGSGRRRRRRCGSAVLMLPVLPRRPRFTKRRRGYTPQPMCVHAAGELPRADRDDEARAAALRDAEVPHLLGGGLAAWARGGPPTEHDVDFFVRAEDAERALEALVEAGHAAGAAAGGLAAEGLGRRDADRPHLPPERRARSATSTSSAPTSIEVMAQPMPVASLDDVLTTKLLSLTEQEPDFGERPRARARRCASRSTGTPCGERTEHSPFARAFFTLVEELGIVEPPNVRKAAAVPIRSRRVARGARPKGIAREHRPVEPRAASVARAAEPGSARREPPGRGRKG